MILIADDHALVRGGMVQLFALAGDIEVVAQATNGGVVASLRAAALDLGISTALGWLVEAFRKHDDAVCRLVVKLHDRVACERQALALFRIAQESLTNISRHAAATEVHVLLRVQCGDWQLQISENGCGFDPVVTRTGSFGLLGMRERVLAGHSCSAGRASVPAWWRRYL